MEIMDFLHFYLLNNSTTNKKGHGGKKRRTNDADENANEPNEETTFDRERFWEVPLQLDTNIETKRDSCLVPAEQITLRERDFDEPSQIDDAHEEVCFIFVHLLFCCCCDAVSIYLRCAFIDQLFNGGFGEDAADESTLFGFDGNATMDSNWMGVDENMNDIMQTDVGFEPIQSPNIDSTQRSVHDNANENENAAHAENADNVANGNNIDNDEMPSLLAELSAMPSTIPKVVRKKKSVGKNRRKTLMIDEERKLSAAFMEERLSK